MALKCWFSSLQSSLHHRIPQRLRIGHRFLEGFKVGLEKRYDWKSVEETEPSFPTSLFVAELMLMPLPYQKRRLEIYSLEGIKRRISINWSRSLFTILSTMTPSLALPLNTSKWTAINTFQVGNWKIFLQRSW